MLIKRILSNSAILFSESVFHYNENQKKKEFFNTIDGRTESSIEIFERERRLALIKNWSPLIASVSVIGVACLFSTFNSYIDQVPANVALENLINNYENGEFISKENLGLVKDTAKTYLGYCKDIVSLAFERYGYKELGATYLLYVGAKTLINEKDVFLNTALEEIKFKDTYKTENKLIDFFKKELDCEDLNCFNNFEIFKTAKLINSNNYKKNLDYTKVGLQFKKIYLKTRSFVKHNNMKDECNEINNLILDLQDPEKMKKRVLEMAPHLNESNINDIFDSVHLEKQKKTLFEMLESSIDNAKQRKLEDETMLAFYLILDSEESLEIKNEKMKLFKSAVKELSTKSNKSEKWTLFHEALQEDKNGIYKENHKKIKDKIKYLIPEIIEKEKIIRIPESKYIKEAFFEEMENMTLKNLVVKMKTKKGNNLQSKIDLEVNYKISEKEYKEEENEKEILNNKYKIKKLKRNI
tara:strand:+ start:9126 stop:10532 length:1407 start_codon:yes stop_codon:yes gene_type:complete